MVNQLNISISQINDDYTVYIFNAAIPQNTLVYNIQEHIVD